MHRETIGWLSVVTAAALLTACSAQPSGVSLTPGGQEIPSAGRVLAGTLTGSQIGPASRVALVGFFANSSGIKLDAQGQPLGDDVVVSVPVVGGRYGIGLPVPPSGPSAAPSPAVRGRFGVMIFNDTNGNARFDSGEPAFVVPEAELAVSFQPFAGYSIQRNNVSSTDPTFFDRVNLVFN